MSVPLGKQGALTTGVIPKRSSDALELPNGARFYRCALQVNPFHYVQRHAKETLFATEEAYNQAMVSACVELGIEVIAVTDHYRIKESRTLIQRARAAGIQAFGGFEAVTKDGVHFLCIFDPKKDEMIERLIGECGVHSEQEPSPTGDLDSAELLERVPKWPGVCIAAHVASTGGLLRTLSGQARIKVWTLPQLLACSIPGPVSDTPEGVRIILLNKDAQHHREREVAVINAQDACSPEDLAKPGAACWIKMSVVSVEGFRQAFLDPSSRIRLNSDPQPEPHAEFLAISWEGGFLNDASIHFNENLNVLVGGRGTGKSTVIESLRYVLGVEPIGEEATRIHQGVIRSVLRSGTKVSLLIRCGLPSPKVYAVERTVPNPPTIRDEQGRLLNLSPKDVIPSVEVFGQHEISELTRSPERLTQLLRRFVDVDPTLSGRKSHLQLELDRSRTRIQELLREIRTVEERLATLPGLEETLKRFQESGLEDRLKEKSLLIREERVLKTIVERIVPLRDTHHSLTESLPIDVAFLSSKSLDTLPNRELLNSAARILQRLSASLAATGGAMAEALKLADTEIAELRRIWEENRGAVESTYQKLLRELHKSKVDGEEFIRLRQQIEELRPLRERREVLDRDLGAYTNRRRDLLSDWEDLKAQEYRAISAAGTKVSRHLKDRVRVEVKLGGNLAPLEKLLRDLVGGNLNATMERLRNRADLSLPELAAACREGKEALVRMVGLPSGGAERIAQAGPDVYMRVEELELPATTAIELNVATEGDDPIWRSLDDLSTGQKATAVLLLLLLESQAPLVVDQPEDDLDNRFITEGVVPIMKREKRRRQFIFSTHNANIPVLSDAELIVGLSASGEAEQGQARIPPQHMGSIDSTPVRELVEEILEGGKSAFEMRRLKYGF